MAVDVGGIRKSVAQGDQHALNTQLCRVLSAITIIVVENGAHDGGIRPGQPITKVDDVRIAQSDQYVDLIGRGGAIAFQGRVALADRVEAFFGNIKAIGKLAICLSRRGQHSGSAADRYGYGHTCETRLAGVLQAVAIEVVEDCSMNGCGIRVIGIAKFDGVAPAEGNYIDVDVIGRGGAIAGWVLLVKTIDVCLVHDEREGTRD